MNRWVALAMLCLLASCSDDDSAVAGPGGAGSGGAAGTGAGGNPGGSAGAEATCKDVPIAGAHDTLLPDQGIAPVAAVKHDIAIDFSAALDGFVVAHVTRTVEKEGLALELRAVRATQGALDPGAPLLVTDDGASSPSNAGWPSMAANEDGSRLLVVWGDDRLGSGVGPIEIQGQFFELSTSGMSKSGANFVISSQPATNDWRPHVEFAAAANRFWVAWADDRAFADNGARHVWARSVGVEGSLGPELELGNGASWQDGVRAASDGERVLFVWSHADETTNPIVSRHLARFVDATSGALGPLEILFERESVVLMPPGVAHDPLRCRYLIVWQESDNRQIWGLLVNGDGSTAKPRFQITSIDAGAGSPHLAYAAASRTYLLSFGTWQDAEGYVLELDGDGDPLGAPRSMHQAPPQNGTYFQDIAAGAGHALAISNEDYARIEGTLLGMP